MIFAQDMHKKMIYVNELEIEILKHTGLLDKRFNIFMTRKDTKEFIKVLKVSENLQDEEIIYGRGKTKRIHHLLAFKFATWVSKEFEIKVTAKDLAGVGKFTFMAQNDYFSDFIEIEVTTQKPIEIYNLRNEYSILYGSAIDINFSIKNPRGDNFTFKIDNSVNGYFTSAPVKTQIDNVLSDTNLIHVIAQSEGSNQMILKITDTTLEPEYSIDIPIRITVVKSDEQKTAEELQLREEAIYKCNNLVLDKSIYEYVSDVYDENGDEVFAPNGILSIRSDNSLYPSHPLYSTLLILYPVGVDNDGATLSNSFYSYNHNDMRYLGEIKYSSNLKGKEFFVKYYDSTTNSVICEKHRF